MSRETVANADLWTLSEPGENSLSISEANMSGDSTGLEVAIFESIDPGGRLEDSRIVAWRVVSGDKNADWYLADPAVLDRIEVLSRAPRLASHRFVRSGQLDDSGLCAWSQGRTMGRVGDYCERPASEHAV